MSSRVVLAGLLVCVTVGLAGCPKSGGKSSAVRIPKSENPAAERRFHDARAKFEDGDFSSAREEFEAFIQEFPGDPLAEIARLYAGRASFGERDFTGAIEHLEPLQGSSSTGVGRKARYFLGLSLVHTGEHARARKLLGALGDDLGKDESRADVAAALAEATFQLGDLVAALVELDRWWPEATPAERAHILERTEAAAAKLDRAKVGAAYRLISKRSGVAALLAVRVAAEARSDGDAARAREVIEETAEARAEAGLPAEATPRASGGGDPRVIGALVGVSGAQRQVGERALRGLSLALELAPGSDPTASAGRQVVVRDPGEEPAAQTAAVDALVAEGALAVIGPLDKKAAAQAARRAAELGLPMITLTLFEGDAKDGAFAILPTAEARARALAERAKAHGGNKVGVLAPDSAYGKKVGGAFAERARELGLTVLATETYAKDAVSFGKEIGKLLKAAKDVDTLFVPDTAKRLELIAPALAAADLWSLPAADKPVKGRRILLLSTAEGLGPDMLRNAGRYVQAAVLAPGFYADLSDAVLADYVARYRTAYAEEPGLFDAAAFDAALVIRRAIERGARDRERMIAGIANTTHIGVTGAIRFGGDGTRVDGGHLFTVAGDQIVILPP